MLLYYAIPQQGRAVSHRTQEHFGVKTQPQNCFGIINGIILLSSQQSAHNVVCKRTKITKLAPLYLFAYAMVCYAYLHCRYGRKPTAIITSFGMGIIGSALSASVNITMYTILKILLGILSSIGLGGAWNLC